MANLSKCYKSSNGKVYCYDRDIGSWVEFVTHPIAKDEIPGDVIEKMLDEMVENDG